MKKRAKVVAVAKAIHKFIAYCHAKLIALLPRNRYTLSVQAGIKTLATISLYRLLGGAHDVRVVEKLIGCLLLKNYLFYSRFALAVSCKILVLSAVVAYLPDTLHVQLPCAVEGILMRDSSPSSI